MPTGWRITHLAQPSPTNPRVTKGVRRNASSVALRELALHGTSLARKVSPPARHNGNNDIVAGSCFSQPLGKKLIVLDGERVEFIGSIQGDDGNDAMEF